MSKTISYQQIKLTTDMLNTERHLPRTRGDCPKIRPCPYVSCKYNTYLDVTPKGSIYFTWPDINPDEVSPELSCVLDMADSGGAYDELQLRMIGAALNCTRERIRQIESRALARLKLHLLHYYADDYAPEYLTAEDRIRQMRGLRNILGLIRQHRRDKKTYHSSRKAVQKVRL